MLSLLCGWVAVDFGSEGGSSRLWEIKNNIYLILKRWILGGVRASATGADLPAGHPSRWLVSRCTVQLGASIFSACFALAEVFCRLSRQSRFKMYWWLASACSFLRKVSAGHSLTFCSSSDECQATEAAGAGWIPQGSYGHANQSQKKKKNNWVRGR